MSDDDMNKLIERQGQVQDAIDASGGWELDNKIEVAMDALRCPDGDASVVNLSGGEKRRIALCRLLLQQPDILLLDEPTNHLDLESIQAFNESMENFKGIVLISSHDHTFLQTVANRIIELTPKGAIDKLMSFDEYLENREARKLSGAMA